MVAFPPRHTMRHAAPPKRSSPKQPLRSAPVTDTHRPAQSDQPGKRPKRSDEEHHKIHAGETLTNKAGFFPLPLRVISVVVLSWAGRLFGPGPVLAPVHADPPVCPSRCSSFCLCNTPFVSPINPPQHRCADCQRRGIGQKSHMGRGVSFTTAQVG